MNAPIAKCTACGAEEVRAVRSRTALWHEERLVVVEDIPALECANCGEQYYDDATVVALDLLRGDGFDPGNARRTITVDVFSLAGAPVTAREEP